MNKLTENAKNVTDVVKKENTVNPEQNVVVKKTKNSEITEAFAELKNENEKLGRQISDLTQQMRLMGESPKLKEVSQQDLEEKVWWKIRKFQAEKRGINLKDNLQRKE